MPSVEEAFARTKAHAEEDAGVRQRPQTTVTPTERHPLTLRRLRDVADELEAQGAREWDVEGIIVHRQHGALGSTPKAGKGWDVVDLTISVASGTPWLDHFACPHAGPVALYPGEEDAFELRRRLRAVGDARGIDVLALPIYVAENTPRLSRPDDLRVFRQDVATVRPRLTIIDPMYKAAAGGDPRSLVAMGEMLSEASDIAREHGSSFLTVPHFNRDTTRKGAERFTGAGPHEWGRFLIAGTVTVRRNIERGTEVVRSVEVTGTSIPDRAFVVTRRITSLDDDPDSPLTYDVNVMDAPADETTHSELDYSLRTVLSLLGPEAEPRTVEQLQDLMKAKEPKRNPYTRPTMSEKLNALTDLGLVDGLQVGGGPKQWWRVVE